jgi:hypothetical protein
MKDAPPELVIREGKSYATSKDFDGKKEKDRPDRTR